MELVQSTQKELEKVIAKLQGLVVCFSSCLYFSTSKPLKYAKVLHGFFPLFFPSF